MPGDRAAGYARRGVPSAIRDSARRSSTRCSARRSTRAARRPRRTSTLPAGEQFTHRVRHRQVVERLQLVSGQLSSSLIQVNTDLPIFIDRALDLACHEGYPGHHVYNVLLEHHLVRERGWRSSRCIRCSRRSRSSRKARPTSASTSRIPAAERVAFETRAPVSACRSRPGDRAEVLRGLAPSSTRWTTPATKRPAATSTAGSPRSQAVDYLVTYTLTSRQRAEQRRALLRPVPQLRHQLQPRQGSRARLRRSARAAPPTSRMSAGGCSAELLSSPRLPSGLVTLRYNHGDLDDCDCTRRPWRATRAVSLPASSRPRQKKTAPARPAPERHRQADINTPAADATHVVFETTRGHVDVGRRVAGRPTLVFDLLGDLYTVPIEGGIATRDQPRAGLRPSPAVLSRRQDHRLHVRRKRDGEPLARRRRRHEPSTDHQPRRRRTSAAPRGCPTATISSPVTKRASARACRPTSCGCSTGWAAAASS